MMTQYRYRRRERKMIEDVPLTPLIDTALTLLIIFMITSPMIHNAIKIDLPEGKSKEDSALQQKITVFIDKEGGIYLNEQKMDLPELIASLSQDMLKNSDGVVYVRADLNVSYGSVFNVVDQLKVAGGVRYVALASKRA